MAAEVTPAKGAKTRENKDPEKNRAMKEPLIYKDECYNIVGDCFSVYKNKGSGFLKPVYQECLEIELEHLKIPFVAHLLLQLEYRGRILKQKFCPDFTCYGKIILEIKAVSTLVDEHRSQVLNYLNATGYQLGLLVNFGSYPKIQYERLVNTAKSTIQPPPSFSL